MPIKKREVKRAVAVTRKKERPLGVTILAVLQYIGAALSLLGAAVLFILFMMVQNNPQVLSMLAQQVPELTPDVLEIIPLMLVVFTIILTLLAILYFFIARGFWKGRNWARLLVIIMLIIGAVGSIFDIIKLQNVSAVVSAIIGLIIQAGLVWYLMRPHVVIYFRKK